MVIVYPRSRSLGIKKKPITCVGNGGGEGVWTRTICCNDNHLLSIINCMITRLYNHYASLMIEMFHRKTKCFVCWSEIWKRKYTGTNVDHYNITSLTEQNIQSSFHSVLEICRRTWTCGCKSRCRDSFNYTLLFMKSTSKMWWSHKVKSKPDDNQRF